MEISLRSPGLRRAAMALEVAGSLSLAIWISKAYLAKHVARKPTIPNFQFALKLDPANAGHHLRAFLKTQGITSESGPLVEVRDVYHPAALDKFSNDLVGDTTAWTSASLDFTGGPKTELITVGLSCLPGQKFDNLIAGKVWMDDLVLTAMPGTSSEGRSAE
jgi:hypothetical protein